MERIWFIYFNEEVSGPFSTDEVNDRLDKSSVPVNSFIWSKGQKEWLPAAQWKKDLPELLEQRQTNEQRPVWKFRIKGTEYGPMTQHEMLAHLATLESLDGVEVSLKDAVHWDDVFNFGDVVEQLGHSRRAHPRAPLIGEVEVSTDNGDYIYRTHVATISVGGIGLKSSGSLRIGDTVRLFIQSQALQFPVRSRARVLYISPDGFTGLQFVQLSTEAAATIIDYIRQFREKKGNYFSQAA